MIGWRPGSELKRLEGISPRLASWDRYDHPNQVRLRAFLEMVVEMVGELPDMPLALHLQIGRGDQSRLLRDHDLENYLTPLVQHLVERLQLTKLVLASAVKDVGESSQITLSEAVAFDLPQVQFRHQCEAGQQWKTELRDAMISSGVEILQPGPVEVYQLFRCSPESNWVDWWKPAGDAMGPVLGEPRPDKPFSPNDDRIVSLTLMRVTDASIARRSFEVNFWWRSLADTQRADLQFLPSATTAAPQAPVSVPKAKQPLRRVIDGALQAAGQLGATQTSVSIADIHHAFLAMECGFAGKSRNSFSATVSYHTINMQSRCPKPNSSNARAAWITEPVFYRTSPGQYRILTARQLAKFYEAVAKDDARLFLSEYDALDLVGDP